jgi:hypothetical protein
VEDFHLEGPEQVQGWQVSTEGIFQLSEKSLNVADKAAFAAAKRKELQSFFDNQVWQFCEKVDPARTMRARFLLKWRKGDNGEQEAKARLVIQGFRDPDALEGKLQTSSPTASRIARQLLLALAAIEGWTISVADVQTAFLQGKPQERTLYVQLPAEAAKMLGIADHPYMLLLKPMYGQKDAPRSW